jgi:hypothetical protein
MAPEAAVRDTLRQEVRAKSCVSETIDEFWVPRTNERADLAAIGSRLWGFEIKTDRDTLRRLPRQVEAYNRLFDMCLTPNFVSTAPRWKPALTQRSSVSGWPRPRPSMPLQRPGCTPHRSVKALAVRRLCGA